MATYLLFRVLNDPLVDTLGNALAGGRIDTYLAGTSTPVATYSDNTGTSYGTSITLDSLGKTPHGWYGDAAVSYKIRVFSSLNVEQTSYQQDNVTFANPDEDAPLPNLQRGRSAIDGTQNNYALDAIATSEQTRIDWWEWEGAAACTLTGIDDGVDGRLLIIDNITTGQILTLSHQSGSSSVGNRLSLGSGLSTALGPGQRALALYDGTDTVWRVTVSASTRAGGSTTQNIAPMGVLAQSVTSVGNVGAGEDTLNAFTISASTLSANGQRLTGYFVGSFAANANVKRLRLKFGTTLILDMGAAAAPNAQNWRMDFSIARTGAATQKMSAALSSVGTFGAVSGTNATTTGTETLSGDLALTLTGEATSTDDIVNTSAVVYWHEVP